MSRCCRLSCVVVHVAHVVAWSRQLPSLVDWASRHLESEVRAKEETRSPFSGTLGFSRMSCFLRLALPQWRVSLRLPRSGCTRPALRFCSPEQCQQATLLARRSTPHRGLPSQQLPMQHPPPRTSAFVLLALASSGGGASGGGPQVAWGRTKDYAVVDALQGVREHVKVVSLLWLSLV